MSSTKRKLRLMGAFAALGMLALAVSCTGFFQNPTLTTITIDPPTPSISQGATEQLTATGTYQDGSTWRPQSEGECFSVIWRDPQHPDVPALPPRQIEINAD